MSGEFPNTQESTRGQFCLVTVSVKMERKMEKNEESSTISDLG
jgi:hypothetical protein